MQNRPCLIQSTPLAKVTLGLPYAWTLPIMGGAPALANQEVKASGKGVPLE
jgi:hypothetical protein